MGQTVTLEVDQERRADIARNHSATHLLQAALREFLGEHVHQKGSLVTPDRLRFDLTHFHPVSGEEKRKIETRVNQWVRENLPVAVHLLSRKEAAQKGAMALFGEKYGETVRMIEINRVSRELCGGTHTQRTGDIGLFKIVSESGVAAGVRRIEAVTGRGALDLVHGLEDRIAEAAAALKAAPEEIADKIARLQEEIKGLRKELKAEREKKHSEAASADLWSAVKEINGIKTLVAEVEVAEAKELRPLGDQVRDRLKSGVARARRPGRGQGPPFGRGHP